MITQFSIFRSALNKVALSVLLAGVSATAIGAPPHKHNHSVDLGIINQDKLISMLKDGGQIPADANETDAIKALHQYLEANHTP